MYNLKFNQLIKILTLNIRILYHIQRFLIQTHVCLKYRLYIHIYVHGGVVKLNEIINLHFNIAHFATSYFIWNDFFRRGNLSAWKYRVPDE